LSCCTSITNVDELSGLTDLNELYLSHCENLSCIDGLKNLVNLEYLVMYECEALDHKELEHLQSILNNCYIEY
jgi:hypothetical protein